MSMSHPVSVAAKHVRIGTEILSDLRPEIQKSGHGFELMRPSRGTVSIELGGVKVRTWIEERSNETVAGPAARDRLRRATI
jgi:hypothetical protein